MFNLPDLDSSPKIPLRNFTLKNCLFGATNKYTLAKDPGALPRNKNDDQT